MRYFFGQPQPWADEAVAWLMVLTVMLAMPDAQRLGEHVAVDTLSAKLRGRGRRVLTLVSLLAVAATAAVLIWEGWAMVAFSRMAGMASNISGFKLWWIQMLVPIGFALLLAVAVAQIARVLHGREPVDAPPDDGIRAGPLE
jgi:TRAP-type C4-dicarboxylate transport system permease small subunit